MTRPGQVTLQRRVDTALVVAGVVLVASLVAASVALAQVRQRQHEVVDVYFTAITETERSYREVLNAETAVRGYLLTGDDRTLEPLQQLMERPADEQPPDIEAMLQTEFGASSRIVLTRQLAADAAVVWYSEWAVPAMDAVRAGGPDAVTAADVEEGRQLFDEVRGPVEEHAALLREGRERAVAGLEQAGWLMAAAVGILSVLLLAGGALLGIFLRRWVTRPLEKLAEDARVVSEGDLTHPVRTVGTGEVAEVSTVVEDMREHLVAALREADAAKGALEESHERLREQAEDLARSNRDLEQFAYVASHDLQEPLRKVASFTQLLAKRYEGQLDERADQYIGFAVDGAKRMQRLINDLLGFSRVGRIGGEVADVDMAAVLDEVTQDLSQLVEETGATVVGEGLPVVRGERPLLTQLLSNLVGNAIKFRDPERAPVVRITARAVEGAWELACVDNGIGIDTQYADRVFVIFQRLHAKEVYEGTGIGLAVCKKIVEYHGGDIWVDPDVAQGTTVRWTLPLPEDNEAADAETGTRTLTGPGTDPGTDPSTGAPHEQEVTRT